MLKKHHFRKSELNIYGESVKGEDWLKLNWIELVWLLQKQIYLLFTYNTESLTFERSEHFLFSYQAFKSPVNCFFSLKVHVLKDKK